MADMAEEGTAQIVQEVAVDAAEGAVATAAQEAGKAAPEAMNYVVKESADAAAPQLAQLAGERAADAAAAPTSAPAAAAVIAEPSLWQSIALWFFIGAVFALLLYLLINWWRNREK